jgi:hypothetical protein
VTQGDPWLLASVADSPVDVTCRVTWLEWPNIGDLHTLPTVIAEMAADDAAEALGLERRRDAIFGEPNRDRRVGTGIELAAEHSETVADSDCQFVYPGDTPLAGAHGERKCCRRVWLHCRYGSKRANSKQPSTWFQLDLDSVNPTSAGDVDQDGDIFALDDACAVGANLNHTVNRSPQGQCSSDYDNERGGQRQDVRLPEGDSGDQPSERDQTTHVEQRQTPSQVTVTSEPNRGRRPSECVRRRLLRQRQASVSVAVSDAGIATVFMQ